MYKSARLALRSTGDYLVDEYEETLLLLEKVAVDLEKLRVEAVTVCSHSALGHPPLEAQTGDTADTVATACQRFLRRLDSARYEVATCASPLLEMRAWLLDVASKADNAERMVPEHSPAVVDAADTMVVYDLITHMGVMVNRMYHSFSLRALRGDVLGITAA